MKTTIISILILFAFGCRNNEVKKIETFDTIRSDGGVVYLDSTNTIDVNGSGNSISITQNGSDSLIIIVNGKVYKK